MMLFVFKSAITLALLYSCFFFLLSKETFHRFNRCMLLGIMVVSLIVPLLHFTTAHPTVVNEELYAMQTYMESYTLPEQVVYADNSPRIVWMQVVTYGYLAGVAVMVVLSLLQAIDLIRLIHGGLRHTDPQGNTVVLQKGKVTPCSFFHFIMMNVQDYEQHSQYILTHEQEHIRLGHTYDLLLLEVMKTFQWFNPFIWFISRDLKAVHEYEADQAVIHQGIDAKKYQQLLVTKVVGNRLQPFTNNLSHGSLKKRITMMYQKPKTRWGMLKALCAIPVVALTLNAFATPIETDPVEDMVKTLETTKVPAFNEVKETLLAPMEETVEAAIDNNAPFAIHPVRDQYGRIIGFSHEGEPAAGDFACTYEYVFINGRQATEAEVRNYKNYSAFQIIKNADGTPQYNYKDKHGIICFTSIEDEPLVLLDGKVVELPAEFPNKKKNLEDEDVLAQLLHINKEDIASVTVLRNGAATAIYGEKAKNGVISIETKAFQAQPKDTVVVKNKVSNVLNIDELTEKLPGAEKHDDGSITINGKPVKKITLEGETIYPNNDDDNEVFLVCEQNAAFPGGQEALMQYLATQLHYPKEAHEHGIQGRMIVEFIVEKDGSLSNLKVAQNGAENTAGNTATVSYRSTKEQMEKGLEVKSTPEQFEAGSKALEREALRIVKNMPKWEPAKQRGRVVRMKYTLPISFRLQ